MWAALGKAAVGAVKGGAKKIATDKLMNRKKKTDARRAAAQKMMGGEEGGEEKGGAIVVRPKAALVQSPASAIEKYSGGDQQQSGGGEDLQGIVLRIKTSTIQVEKLLGNSVALQKQQIDDARKAREAAQLGKAEADLEKKKPKVKSKGPKIKIPGKGLLGGIVDFITNIIFGWVMVRLIEFGPKLKGLLVWLGRILDWTITGFGWILNGLITLVDWGYKFVAMGRGLVKNVFGEEGAKKFDTFMSSLKNLISGFLIWKLIGEKIFKALVQNIRNTWNVIKGVFKQAGKFLNWMTGGRVGNLAKNILSKGGNLVKNVGGKILNVGKNIIGGGGQKALGGLKSIFKKGLGKAARRLVIKFFGKTAGKMFGKIPIIGPVIVGVISLMSGEPIGQALFKTMGAAVGGLLGTFIPIPIIGTLLGEAVGVFVGDLLYHLIVKRDPKAAFKMLKDTVMGIFKGGKAIVEWLFGGGLFTLLSKGGGLLWKFGKWIFFDAIPWVLKKLGGAAKLMKEWFQRGMTRFSENFPVFDLPLMKFNILGLKININQFLGKTIGQIPWFQQWVDGDKQLMHFPDFTMFVPGLGLPFLIGHTGKSLFPGSFFESWPSGASSFVNPMAKYAGGKIDEAKDKVQQEKERRKNEGGWFGWGKKDKTNEVEEELKVSETQNGKDELNKSISKKAEYEEVGPVVVTVPVLVKSSTQGSTTVVSTGAGGGSGNDPYEVLDFQG